MCPVLTWPREGHDNKPLDVSRTSSCPYFPGRMLRVRQNVSDHILAEIQLVRSAHGTTCSPTPSLLLTLTVSQETLSLCNIDRFISSQSLANDLRMRDAAASVGKCPRATERSPVDIILSRKYDHIILLPLGGAP